MSRTLIASSWRTDGNASATGLSIFDETNLSLMAAWPFQVQQEFEDEPPASSFVLTPNRRLMPELPDDDEPSSSTAVTKKKTDTSSSSNNSGTSKKRRPTKKPAPAPTISSAKKPETVSTPVKKPKGSSVDLKKNLPDKTPEPVVTAASPAPSGRNKPDKILPPQVKDKTSDSLASDSSDSATAVIPKAEEPQAIIESGKTPLSGAGDLKKNFELEDSGPEVSPPESESDYEPNSDLPTAESEPIASGSIMSPPDPPISESVGTTPEPESDNEPKSDTPTALIGPEDSGFLTVEATDDDMGERLNTNGPTDIFSRIEDFFGNILENIFPEIPEKPEAASDVPSYIPVAFAPPRNPKPETEPIESFRAGYISQRDLEDALGREDWTMCCAATFVYAVQSRYPGLDRTEILEAAEKAADTQLADGSGSCVSDDGYVSSVYQYSQALSRNLGLKDYVDTPGQYTSVEAARDAGVGMMKVELSGTIGYEPKEHHVFSLGENEIDPVPGNGINDVWDAGSREVINVMALDWYVLP